MINRDKDEKSLIEAIIKEGLAPGAAAFLMLRKSNMDHFPTSVFYVGKNEEKEFQVLAPPMILRDGEADDRERLLTAIAATILRLGLEGAILTEVLYFYLSKASEVELSEIKEAREQIMETSDFPDGIDKNDKEDLAVRRPAVSITYASTTLRLVYLYPILTLDDGQSSLGTPIRLEGGPKGENGLSPVMDFVEQEREAAKTGFVEARTRLISQSAEHLASEHIDDDFREVLTKALPRMMTEEIEYVYQLEECLRMLARPETVEGPNLEKELKEMRKLMMEWAKKKAPGAQA